MNLPHCMVWHQMLRIDFVHVSMRPGESVAERSKFQAVLVYHTFVTLR